MYKDFYLWYFIINIIFLFDNLIYMNWYNLFGAFSVMLILDYLFIHFILMEDY
jgi:hypothetical protein